jgi:CTP synthase (UTP-ammonia lyase)
MSTTARIALIGDYDPSVPAHVAIPLALDLAANVIECRVEPAWLATPSLAADAAMTLASFHGVWCVPASPYASMDGALNAIRFARERGVPFLGTCGGFQHTLIEYARNVRGHVIADHAESNPHAALPLIGPLSCPLVEASGRVSFVGGSRVRTFYGRPEAEETYRCRFGLNDEHRALVADDRLRLTGFDDNGEPRVAELAGHPFFVATLYQPERSALVSREHPLVRAFLRAARERAGA